MKARPKGLFAIDVYRVWELVGVSGGRGEWGAKGGESQIDTLSNAQRKD